MNLQRQKSGKRLLFALRYAFLILCAVLQGKRPLEDNTNYDPAASEAQRPTKWRSEIGITTVNDAALYNISRGPWSSWVVDIKRSKFGPQNVLFNSKIYRVVIKYLCFYNLHAKPWNCYYSIHL